MPTLYTLAIAFGPECCSAEFLFVGYFTSVEEREAFVNHLHGFGESDDSDEYPSDFIQLLARCGYEVTDDSFIKWEDESTLEAADEFCALVRRYVTLMPMGLRLTKREDNEEVDEVT